MRNVRFIFAIDGNRQLTEKNFIFADFFQFYEYQEDVSELKFIS